MTLPLEGISHYILSVETNSPNFTVNTAVNEVPIVFPASIVFEDGFGQTYFTYGDNVFIESIRFQLDYSFGNGENNFGVNEGMLVSMVYEDFNANTGNLTQFGANGRAQYPTLQCDLPVESFIRQPDNVDSKWRFILFNLNGSVSMLNVPSALNGQNFLVRVYLKIRHTLEMIN